MNRGNVICHWQVGECEAGGRALSDVYRERSCVALSELKGNIAGALRKCISSRSSAISSVLNWGHEVSASGTQ